MQLAAGRLSHCHLVNSQWPRACNCMKIPGVSKDTKRCLSVVNHVDKVRFGILLALRALRFWHSPGLFLVEMP